MNKLIYAIGIAVASTFATSNKTHTTKTPEKEHIKTEQVKTISDVCETDSLNVNLP